MTTIPSKQEAWSSPSSPVPPPPCVILVRCLVLRRPGLVAVVYDLEPHPRGPVLVRRIHDTSGLVQRDECRLTGCCLACTVRQDAARAVELVDRAQRWGEAVMALPAAVEPGQLARVLSGRDGVPVATVTTVVDAVLPRQRLEGDDLLAERGLTAADVDRRSTAELVVRQLEDADVLAVVDLQRSATARPAPARPARRRPCSAISRRWPYRCRWARVAWAARTSSARDGTTPPAVRAAGSTSLCSPPGCARLHAG